MRLLIVLLAVVATVMAQDGRPPSPPDMPTPPGEGRKGEMGGMGHKTPCCFPDQWSGKSSIDLNYRDGKGNVYDVSSKRQFAYDFPANKMMFNEFTYNKNWEPEQNYTLYCDLSKKEAHAVQHDKNDQCIQYELPSALQGQCITDKAEFLGSSSVGLGDASIAVDHYKAIMKKGELDLYMKIGVTAEGCVPIYSMIGGSLGQGAEFTINSKFYNNSASIADPAVFKAPDTCEDAPEMEVLEAAKGVMFLNWAFFPDTSPQKCCFPEAWEGKMQQYSQETVNGQTTRSYVYMPVAVDYGKRKFSVKSHIMIEGAWYRNVTFIGDLGYGVLYAKDRETKECKKYNIPATEKMSWECITPEAKYYGKKTLGLKNSGLDTSIWKMRFEEENDATWNLTLSVTQQDGVCVPLAEMLLGDKPDSRRMIDIGFFDISEKVKDESVFLPPEGCSGSAAESWKDMPPVLFDVIEDFVEGFF